MKKVAAISADGISEKRSGMGGCSFLVAGRKSRWKSHCGLLGCGGSFGGCTWCLAGDEYIIQPPPIFLGGAESNNKSFSEVLPLNKVAHGLSYSCLGRVYCYCRPIGLIGEQFSCRGRNMLNCPVVLCRLWLLHLSFRVNCMLKITKIGMIAIKKNGREGWLDNVQIYLMDWITCVVKGCRCFSRQVWWEE